MRRRDFLGVLGGTAAAWPLAALAQQVERVRHIGVLIALAENDPESRARIAAFRKGLQDLGWIEGLNIRIDYRWAAGDADRMQVHAGELLRLQPDVIFAGSGTALAPLRRQTQSVPIVFAQLSDPVGSGVVASVARPGGNVTGFAQLDYEVALKWVELLKQLSPRVVHVAVIYEPANPASIGHLRMIDTGAPSLGVQVSKYPVRNVGEIERAIATAGGQQNLGIVVLPGPTPSVHRDLIIALAARNRLPAVYPFRYWITGGGLASYGIDNIDLYRRAASYVDRILKGEKPGELPIQFATKFVLAINLKTAKALGLEVPISLLARTDELIE